MKRIKKCLFYLLMGLSTFGFTQEMNSELNQVLTLKTHQKVFVDHLENIYVLDKENLTVVSSKKTKEYQNNFLGEIFSIDISDPLHILVFHKEANQIIYLNNELSEIGKAISLDDLGLLDVEWVCASQISGFWIFNAAYQRLEFYDHRLEKVHSSIDLSHLIGDNDLIQELSMVNENLYLRTESGGILVFDRFASYIKTLPIKDCSSVQFFKQKVLYTQGNEIKSYKSDLLETLNLMQLEQPVSFAKLYNKTLYYRVDNILFKKRLE